MAVIETTDLVYRYGEREALRGVSLSVQEQAFFSLVGPNGGGKSTLFEILATVRPFYEGKVQVLGCSLPEENARVRGRLGVAFQTPALDLLLTAEENLLTSAILYGLSTAQAKQRSKDLLERLGLADRAKERVKSLSGGLRRRVELAKSLIHEPELLLLDEPTTGLDPVARKEFWACLQDLRQARGLTCVMSTHSLEEAEQSTHVGLLDEGKLIACGSVEELTRPLGGDIVALTTAQPGPLGIELRDKLSLPSQVVGDQVRVEVPDGSSFLAGMIQKITSPIERITVSKPNLEDVFVKLTGRLLNEVKL